MSIEEQINRVLVRVASISIAADGDKYRASIKEANAEIKALITKEIKQARIDELRLVLGQDMFKNPDPTEGQLSLHKRIENRLTTLNKD